jgi:hypothetical protein
VLGEPNANWLAAGVLTVEFWVPLPDGTLTVESTLARLLSGRSSRTTVTEYEANARGARREKDGLRDLAIPSPFSPVSEPVVSVREVGVGGFVEAMCSTERLQLPSRAQTVYVVVDAAGRGSAEQVPPAGGSVQTVTLPRLASNNVGGTPSADGVTVSVTALDVVLDETVKGPR